MLIRNVNTKMGMCNGSRLYVKELHQNYIVAQKLMTTDYYLIPRMTLTLDNLGIPIKMKRVQFPIVLNMVMTINKSQGQSFDVVGIDLTNEVFSHGQLYVALSRTRDCNKLYYFCKRDGNCCFTTNIVFQEVLVN